MARIPALLEWWSLYGVAATLLALALFIAPPAVADDLEGESIAGKTATASLRITLTIPPRTQVTAGATGAEALCLRHIPVRFLQVSWAGSGAAQSAGTRIPVARLEGNPYVGDCIPLDSDQVERRDRQYLLITAE